MDHNVRYTRPETRATVSRIFIPAEISAVKQIRRLKALGYTIVDIVPPLPQRSWDWVSRQEKSG